MKVRTHKMAGWGAALASVALALSCAGARADHGNREDRGRHGQRDSSDSGMSRERIVSMVEKRYKARVVRADSIDIDGRPAYQLRLLSDAGRIWTVRVDARTGEQL